MKVTVNKSEYTNPTENLKKLGFNFEGIETDKRGKKHTIFSKEGIDYEFKGCDISGIDPVISLVEIK